MGNENEPNLLQYHFRYKCVDTIHNYVCICFDPSHLTGLYAYFIYTIDITNILSATQPFFFPK